MEPELQTQVNLPVVIINSEGLYVIITVLGVSLLGCACVLTYSFVNYRKLKSNAEDVRRYIASQAMAADQQHGTQPAAQNAGRAPNPSHTKRALPRQQPTESALNKGEVPNKTFPIVATQEDVLSGVVMHKR
ncbi:hypothetical protein HPB48_026370 [Haemaphysalis longicornis]|uniref:Uncharacterized protein n=1 Tax=Haemaphysalis longicornis TaxID=44386 RepID=A0A9J6H9H9_HAELO|nr:hypothetical protein HPB48_026370 [Haemaphysalis longicornis]